MELGLYALIFLPAGLGLLGFVEPCTIGAHLLFLDTQKGRSRSQKIEAVLVFILVRSLVAGLFGAGMAFLGQSLIGVQSGAWLVFGVIYLFVGVLFLTGYAAMVKRQLDFAPQTWKRARNPFVLGLAFGLNIPACAAPILFGLLGLATTTGTLVAGFWMMFVFGLFLSAPLMVFAIVPKFSAGLERVAFKFAHGGRLVGFVFVLLGLWSIWFGLFVDAANWVG